MKNKTATRPPIVTLMGHVDHGKTSILDAIRESQITKTESGGITQHIGAYTVDKDDRKITFIDTPGHEAFTKMRARGGAASDIVILVVAADDGVMPQTKEAIMHAKAAEVPIIVAINKVDLATANVTRVKQQLAENGLAVEGFGGDIVAVEMSAIKKTGIGDLLDVIFLVSEINQNALVANEESPFQLLVIESKHDPKSGVIISGIVKNGKLKVRDEISCGGVSAKVKAIINSQGKRIDIAIPGDAVEVLGFNEALVVGGIVHHAGEDFDKIVSEKNDFETEQTDSKSTGKLPLVAKKILNLVVRADTAGTQEAIVSSINKLKVEDSVPNILFAGTGEVKESDVLLASTGKAIIIAFKVGVPSSIHETALFQKVIIREHEIIYKLLEELEGALLGVLEIEEAKVKGKGLVIEKFVLPKSNMIVAGTLVEFGKLKLNNRIGIFRGESDIPIYIARIKSLHIGPKEVEMASKGDEVGLIFRPEINNIELDDRIIVL